MNNFVDQHLMCADEQKHKLAPSRHARWATAFGHPREFLNNRFVYLVLSARTNGVSVGVNMNPDKRCNFDCVYCEVDRSKPSDAAALDVDQMAEELQQTLALVHGGGLRDLPFFRTVPPELLQLRHVALSGDGEPTLCPNFVEAVQGVVHVRARTGSLYFQMALLTNGTALDAPGVQSGLQYFTREDEIWVKLDAGTEQEKDRVNQTAVPLGKVIENILLVARKRPVVIQSLFPLIGKQEPSEEELDAYTQRLDELKKAGAIISLVQIYSAARPPSHPGCGHLPLRTLSRIAHKVHEKTGLDARVF